MTFALIGAHRSGKSTLAKRLCEDMGFHYHDASFGRIAKDLGFEAVAPQDVGERITMQEKVLSRYLEEAFEAPRPFITDRTPLDMIGYMLGEVTMHNTDPALGQRIQAYVDRCLSATQHSFDSVIILRPLKTYVEEPGKPPLNVAYQSEVQLLIEGAFERINPYVAALLIPSDDFEQRLESASDFLARRCDKINVQRAASILN